MNDGVTCFKLITHETNLKAMRLFHKVGFELCPELESHNPSFTAVMRTKSEPKELVNGIQELLYSHIQRHGH